MNERMADEVLFDSPGVTVTAKSSYSVAIDCHAHISSLLRPDGHVGLYASEAYMVVLSLIKWLMRHERMEPAIGELLAGVSMEIDRVLTKGMDEEWLQATKEVLGR